METSSYISPDAFKSLFPRASRDTVALNAKEDIMLPREIIERAAVANDKIEKPRKQRQMNHTERELMMMLQRENPCALIRYEAYTLKLAPQLRYTPDFSVKQLTGNLETGRIDFYECKGAFVWSRALNKPKMAAQMFEEHRFFIAQKRNGKWRIEQIQRNEG